MEHITALSASYRWVRLVLPPLAALAYLDGLLHTVRVSDEAVSTAGWFALLITPPGIWLLYKWLDSCFATAYDSHFFYLYKQTGTERIPVERITEIKYVFFTLPSRHRWKVRYDEEQGRPQVVRLLPLGASGRSIDGFIAAVRGRNPQVAVRHWYLFFSPR